MLIYKGKIMEVMENDIAIKVTDLEKVYKLYDKPSDRLKEALHIGRGKHHTEHRALKGVNMTIRQGSAWGLSAPTVPVNPRF